MIGNLTGWHLVVILAIVVLIFGATKLPALAKSVGESLRILRGEMKSTSEEKASPEATDSGTTTQSSSGRQQM